jgi:integrase
MPRGTIDQRSGRYRARYPTADGRWVGKSFARKLDAQRWLSTQLASIAHGDWVDPAAGRITFQEFAVAWRMQQPHRPSTAQTTEHRLARVLPAIGQQQLAAITPADIRRLVTSLSGELAPSTVEGLYRLVATIFKAAVADRLISETPCRRIALPRPDGRQVVPMTVEEVRLLADTVPPRYRAAVLAAAGLGVRQGELFGLTVDRIDRRRRTVRVDRQLVSGTGQATGLGPVKTPASVRTIPAPAVVLDALTAHLQEFGEGPDRLVFTTRFRTPVTRKTAFEVWRAAADGLGLPHLRGWHDLRHFYASLLIAGGESVKVVQKRLGHKSAMETLDTYGHLWPDSEESTRLVVDNALGTD